MRAMHARIGVALAVAAIVALLPVPIDLNGLAAARIPTASLRFISPTLPAWAADDEIEIDDVGKVKRGDKHVVFRADVKKPGLVCKLKIKYADGSADSLDDVESDKKGICESSFDVPNRKSVVGDATAKLKLETKQGLDRGKASRNFLVRDRRGGG